MNTYLLNWIDKTTSEVQGDNIAQAFGKCWTEGKQLFDLDYYEQLREANVKQWSVDISKLPEIKEAVRKI